MRVVCRRVYRREIHATTSVKATPRRSPRVVAASKTANQIQGNPVRLRKKRDALDSLPPIPLLNSAHKTGALNITPGEALEFLQEYMEVSEKARPGWEQKLCEDHRITPLNMATLASILNRCNTIPQKSLGKKVMLSASALGEKSATFELISSAIRTGSIQEYDGPLRHLGVLAKKENDPQAMLLLGKVLYGQNSDNEALEWFQKGTRPPTGHLEWNGAAEALVQEGRILLAKKAPLGARKAFEKAALELDDPTGYFYLSEMEEFGSEKQQTYLMKASSAGILEAWHNLGAIELGKRRVQPIKRMSDYGLAREWFLVAASDGFGLSMLNLAVMHRSVEDIDGASRWLEKAMKVDEVAMEARRLRKEWVENVGDGGD